MLTSIHHISFLISRNNFSENPEFKPYVNWIAQTKSSEVGLRINFESLISFSAVIQECMISEEKQQQ